jgi:hypothetical protein
MSHAEIPSGSPEQKVTIDSSVRLDIAVKLPDGKFLRAVGFNTTGQPAKPHEALSDIGLVIGANTDQRFEVLEKIMLIRDIATDFPLQKLKYVKRMVLALAARCHEWYEQYSLSDIVNAIHSLSDKGNNQFHWIFDQQGCDWLDRVICEIYNDDYNRTWDFERRRQDGPAYYEEWRQDTNDQRN